MEGPSSAGYRLVFDKDGDYLHAYVEGPFDNATISKAYWTEIFAVCRAEGFNRVLVEEALAEPATAAVSYEVGTFIADEAPAGLKIAFVDRFENHQELNRFGNLVATNRGIESEVFDQIADAADWLRAGSQT